MSGVGAKTSMRAAVALCAIAALVLPTTSIADTFDDPGFATETIATVPPFTLVGLAFAPDGRLFVWQKNGVVRIIKNGVLLPTPFVNLSSHVNTFDDRGMWGLAFDPNFASNGFVYVTYTYENTGNPNDQGPKTGRLTRITASPTNPDVALPGETVIMGSVGTPPCSAQPIGADCIPSDGGSHTIGEVHFASDGTLLVGVGDGADGGVGDPLPLRAQNLNSIVGKILRINKDGTAPNDNPFYDGTNSVRSKVWLYGVRNPFRFAVDEATGDLWFGEVGWNTWEEVDHGVKGGNYGWPCWEGNAVNVTYQSAGECLALQPGDVRFPYVTWDHSVGTAAIGGPFYTASLYPQQYQGNYFYADYSGNFIKRIVFDSQHNPVNATSFATGVPAPVSLELGPDGMIYYNSFTTGEIRRIRFNGPVAKASANPVYGYSPLAVSFSSAGSVNPGGGGLTYLWNFGDGTTSTAANPTHTYTSASVSSFTARLTVSSGGLSSSATVPIVVGSVPPVPTITMPADGTPALPGQTVTFQGSATDPDQGQLAPSALTWTVLLHHNTHVHTFVGGSGAQGSFVVEDHGPIGTFSYEIILQATDSSGLSATTSVTLPVAADTSPPSVPSNPVASAVSASQVNLSWTASTDNAGVTAYRVERCQGAGCTNFAQVGTPAGVGFTDTGLSASTSYSYRIAALDRSGNQSGYSSTVSATTAAAPPLPAGLVLGFSFDAGSGSSVVDVSGSGNTGSVVGASWSSVGRYGGAMSFNGSSSVVQVPASASLGLSGAMTLSAWIDPAVSQSGWRTIVQRQVDAYFLNASNDTGPLRPSGGASLGGSVQWIGGPSSSPVGSWTHVALTYDGSMLRLYVNATQVASAAASGAIQASSSPLWIGGNQPYGEYFNGLIDDVRVYNRALSQGEIQTDMVTPLGGAAAPDGVPPSVPTNLVASAVSASQVNLSWTASTDNVGVTGYQVERCQGAGCTNFAQIGAPTGTSFGDTGLSASTSYSYRVAALDAAGNVSGYSAVAGVTTPATADTSPPTAPTNLAATAVGSSQVNLSWTASTDNVGVTGYRVERCQGSGCTTFTQVGTPTGTSYNDTGLAASTQYRYRVRAADAAGNLGAYSSIVSATTPAAGDASPPTAPTNLAGTAVSSSQINLTWTASTDNVGVTGYRVERCQGNNCSSFAQVGTPAGTSFGDIGLSANTTYRYRVRAVDAAGNLSAYSAILRISTLAADTSAPSAPTTLVATAAGSSQINLSWTASTDNVGVTGYRVERCQGAGCTTWAQIGTPAGTSFADTGLSASTTYRYRVRAVDAAGNLSSYSAIATATTQAVADGLPPTAPTNLAATAVGSSQVNLSWTSSTDNVGVTGYRVERCQGSGCTTFTQVGTPTGITFNDTGLSPSTSYSYRVLAVDAAGNASGYSVVASASTPAVPVLPAGLVAGYSFDAGSGSSVVDVSGNGNTGVLTGGVSWSPSGRYGGALSFNGSSGLVQVAASSSLALSGAMTLSGWINPAASQSGWRTIVQRQVDAYFLNASNDTGPLRPSGGATLGGTTRWVGGTTSSPVGSWTHVALTYDGSTLRLYVNGVQAATLAASGTIQSSSSPLWIGGNQPYGEYFNGLIDDVRVYNRALSQAEIQTDMATSLGS
jgi:glucose/arabinose dehydrogenase/chitodextrinase